MRTTNQTAGATESVALEAVVIRADGSREQLGTVAYWHRNPLRRAYHRLVKREGTIRCD